MTPLPKVIIRRELASIILNPSGCRQSLELLRLRVIRFSLAGPPVRLPRGPADHPPPTISRGARRRKPFVGRPGPISGPADPGKPPDPPTLGSHTPQLAIGFVRRRSMAGTAAEPDCPTCHWLRSAPIERPARRRIPAGRNPGAGTARRPRSGRWFAQIAIGLAWLCTNTPGCTRTGAAAQIPLNPSLRGVS